jgi:serine/threonine-protein kinase
MLATGTNIAGYRIERLLGSGGMGSVYLATQESLNRPVALKFLSPHLTSDETFRGRFRREGEVQAALDHPHIVPVYEAGATDDGLFLAMRYVRGSTLKELVVDGELDPARTLRLLTPIAWALDAAHAAGLIHRDVKPQNILVDQTDWPYLADFGLTRGNAGGPTRTGQLVGTFAYIAPEQVQGHKASARSDQYALAAVLFECLAGDVPHNHESDAALLYAKVHEEPPRLSQRIADLPAGFDEILARGMARDPADRYPDATALLGAATDALDRAEAAPPAPAPVVAAPPRAPEPAPAPASAPPAKSQDTVLVDAPPAPAKPPKPPRAPRTAPIAVAPWALPAAACAAAVVGFLVAGALSGDDGASSRRVAAGELGTIAVPAELRSARGPAGLGLQSLRAYAAGRGSARRTLAVGSGAAAGPNLLPAGALADAARASGAPVVVRVGAARGLRFGGLTVPGLAGRTQAVTIPTSRGVLVAACAAATAQDAVCAATLGSLAPRAGVRATDVAVPKDYATSVGRLLATYETARAAATRQLRTAGRSATQARAARGLRDAAGALAAGLRKLDAAPPGARPAQDELFAAATRLRAAAARLASAAAGRAQSRYDAAAADTEAADRALRRAVDRLRDVYRSA